MSRGSVRRSRPGTRGVRWAASAACAVLALGACTGEGSDDATPSASASSGGSAGPSATSSAPTTPSEIPSPATAPPTLATDAPGRQDSVLARLPGSSKTGCVEVGTQRDVRSGPMAAGNFADARAAFKASPSAAFPLYVIPVDVSDEKAALSVTVAQRDGSEAKTVKSATTQTAEQWKYHLVQLSVPAAGTWRITATSGAAKGCWDVSFTS